MFGTDYIGVDQVYDAWVKTVNASGGINGHMVQTVLEDDAGVPGTAVTKVEALVSDHVDAMVDMSTVDSAWASTAQQAQIPVVGQNAIGGPMNTNPDFYPEGTTNDTTSYAVVAAAKTSGATDMGAVYCAEAAVCAQIVPVLKSAAKSLGVSVVYSGEIAATAPNYTAQCLSAQEAHTQALYIGDSPTVVVRMAKDCVTQSYSPSFVTSGEGFYPGELTAPGLSKDLWSEYSDFPAFATPPPAFVQSMLDAVNKYYPQLPKNTTGVWSQLPTESWVSGLLLEDAVKAGGLGPTGTPTAAEVTQGLGSLKDDTLGGWAPPAHVRRWPTPPDPMLVYRQGPGRGVYRGQRRKIHLQERLLIPYGARLRSASSSQAKVSAVSALVRSTSGTRTPVSAASSCAAAMSLSVFRR